MNMLKIYIRMIFAQKLRISMTLKRKNTITI